MAIAVGNYIIRSALNEDLVLIVSGGSKSKGAKISTGAFTETDNRCYWHSKIVSTTYNSFNSINTGNNGFIMAPQIDNNKEIVQNAYKIATGAWNVVDSQHTMTVNGSSVSTFYIKAYANDTYYLTVPDNGGDLYLTTFLEDSSANQEFYFEASTILNAKTATPNTLRNSEGDTTYTIRNGETSAIISSVGSITNPEVNKATFETQISTTGQYVFTYDGSKWKYNNAEVNLEMYGITYSGTAKKNDSITVVYCESFKALIFPQWRCSSTATVYEMRYRTRRYDMDGNIITENQLEEGWSSWAGWSLITATAQLNDKKKYTGIMKSNTGIIPPIVNNINYSRTEIQVQVRLTNAKNIGAYTTNGSAHGAVVSEIIMQLCTPSLALTASLYSPDGLALTYETNYAVSGTTITINSITDNGIKLIENYTTQIDPEFLEETSKYVGDLYLNCDELYSLPQANDQIVINAKITEENGVASTVIEQTLTVVFDSSWGLTINPIYGISDRLTCFAAVPEYSTLEFYMEKPQLNGTSLWVPCDKVGKIVVDQEHAESYDYPVGTTLVIFEFAPPYGQAPNLMWLAIDEETNWISSIVAPSNLIINSKFYSWYWTDESGNPRAAILKYQAGTIMQPSDDITLGVNKFITTGREYPVFRYSKTIERVLDIEGIILKEETAQYCTYSDFEKLAIANHCIYRQPDGKWYQVAITGVKFQKEEDYITVTSEQDAETR